jgi:hypothetical protein
MKILRGAILGVLAACGGAQDKTSTPPHLAQYDDDKLASRELCEQAVTRVQYNYEMSPGNHKALFARAGYDRRHRDLVSTCTTRLTEREAACLATAPSSQYGRNCEHFAELQ